MKKCVNANNRRELCINITEKGLVLVEAAMAAEAEQLWKQNALTSKEIQQLNRLLDKVRH